MAENAGLNQWQQLSKTLEEVEESMRQVRLAEIKSLIAKQMGIPETPLEELISYLPSGWYIESKEDGGYAVYSSWRNVEDGIHEATASTLREAIITALKHHHLLP